ncbi:MAG: NAD(P)-dependent oxidoreductase, partial [Acidimicrobiia bacterium]|nr:NAD(P)-dependent oxidoreductase [Acidimicrobiia bacterium]
MIVVTGSSGFIGRHLVDRLVADGRPVVGIDRRPAPDVAGSGRARHRAIVADLAEASSVLRHMLGTASAVVHLAACPGVRDVAPDIAGRRWRDNVLATRHVVAATRADAPLVVASSSSVYGGTVGGRASREDDALCPIGGYARSKVMLERIAAERGAAGGAVTVVRPFTVVGPGQRPDMALSRWIDAAVAGRPLQVYG